MEQKLCCQNSSLRGCETYGPVDNGFAPTGAECKLYSKKAEMFGRWWEQNMIFDTHAHYDDEAFDGDRDALLASMREQGVTGIVNMGAALQGGKRQRGTVREMAFSLRGRGHPS